MTKREASEQITISFTGNQYFVRWMMVAKDCFPYAERHEHERVSFSTVRSIEWFIDELMTVLPEIQSEMYQWNGKELTLGAKLLHDLELDRREYVERQLLMED